MRIYLDNCCFNRPFDDQDQIRIRLETEATAHIQEEISSQRVELAWSYILDYENAASPFLDRKRSVAQWKAFAAVNIQDPETVLPIARDLRNRGLQDMDALHVACALIAECDFFVTTDDAVLKYATVIAGIVIVDPITFAKRG